MSRQFVGWVVVMTLCLATSPAHGERGGKSGEKPKGENSSKEKSEGERSSAEKSGGNNSAGKKPPGGNWSEHNPDWKQGQGKEQPGSAHNKSGAEGAAAGAAAANRNAPQTSGAKGAAAGAAATNRNAPKASGAQGAAAGAAAAKRNQPAASGAQGAAAGAAVANRNQPAVSGAAGAAAGAAVANRNAPAASGAAGAVAGYAAAGNSIEHPSMYDQQWYSDHQNAWSPAGWDVSSAWTPATWTAVAGHLEYGNNTPASYNYGTNVTCIGGNVVIDGQPAGTAEEFSQQASELAEMGTEANTPDTDDWLPLGVFALVRDEHQHPQLVMQLAIDHQGILRGNYTDEVSGSTLPIHGKVDQKTQRAAWTVGDNKYAVMEAGLSNLTEHEAPALIHKNGTTQRWLLVRLAQPSQGGNDAVPAAAPK